MILSVRAGFSAAHLYRQPLWSEAENEAVFGACFSKWGHGHNYNVVVGVADPGDFASRESVKDLVHSLAAELDNRHLNYDISAFENLNPTTENLCLYFAQRIKDSNLSPRLHFIKVYEMESLGSEIHYE